MVFQKTWLDNDIVPLFQLQGYKLYTQCRNCEGGGVALFVTDSVTSSLGLDLCCTQPFLECVCVEVGSSHGNYIYACVYRPPNGNLNYFMAKLN